MNPTTSPAIAMDRAILAGNLHFPVLIRTGDDAWQELTRIATGLAADAFWLVTDAGLPRAHTARVLSALGSAAPTRVLAASGTGTARHATPTPDTVIVALGGSRTIEAAARLAAGPGTRPRLILVPTTPRAMTDTALTLEHPAAHGLAPTLVWAQPDLLRTLPPDGLRTGLAALVRNVLAVSPSFYDTAAALLRPDVTGFDAGLMARVVALNADIRATLMSYDPSEQGPAMAFRYGRTVADALLSLDPRTSEGDAAALGMLVAARIAVLLGLLDPAAERAHHELMERWGAPRELPAPLTTDALAAALRRGAPGGPVPVPNAGPARMVLLDGLGAPHVVRGRMLTEVDDDVLRPALGVIAPHTPVPDLLITH
ncbi:hypothetical protein E2C00_02835 [Streptomyces sp. WAC05374]|uniref:3-dehydroquinate synthase family protein n=1 Tax=Streptomyces sp. WAC05374 TaxID=2487420 RepID=UPI000F88BF6A|nr:hypothetical protein [Streptomyces sp. WAC05374]RST19225.1 hypothetical protein EF905_02185 [Streptomyces sp. WAC05374]TDF50443.1 hypothetical protein E2B92_02815 [Streptomyces sp. WAC05374]TDF51810.1 hypothetical protein E2C02_23000 [Streptomyces sp. WAC05374]TDF60696.1 hypothetical protein E2C00_02835 [Streptomyces sp. WAC05374]